MTIFPFRYSGRVRSVFSGTSLWIAVFGIGIGLLIGVVGSSGFHLDRSESAKFVGSFMGSVFAVSGAVALHYLRDYEIRTNRRKHFSALLHQCSVFLELTIKKIAVEKDLDTSSTLSCKSQLDRAIEYGKKYQFDDLLISQAYLHLLNIHTESLFLKKELMEEPSYLPTISKLLGVFGKMVSQSADALDGYKILSEGQ